MQFVAIDDNHLVGWCCGMVVVDEAELLKIVVHSSRRRKGVGQALLSHLEQTMLSAGCSSIFLEVRSHNDSALKFYLKYGYYQVGFRKNYYSLPTDDAIIMRKDLR